MPLFRITYINLQGSRIQMHITINEILWEIKESEPNNSMLLVDGTRCRGTTHFFHQQIILDNTLKQDTKYNVLCHELAHAFLYVTQLKDKDEFTEEEICNFTGNYARQIIRIADKYFKEDG